MEPLILIPFGVVDHYSLNDCSPINGRLLTADRNS